MASRIVSQVLETAKPRGLNRLVLVVLAESAGDEGTLAWNEEQRALLARRSSMQLDRFDRNVRELSSDGFIDVRDDAIVLTNGGLGAAGSPAPEQPTLLQDEAEASDSASPQGVIGGGRAEARAAVDEVLAHYVDVMQPRASTFGEEERREVRAALKVRTVSQCKEAIDGNKASGYHQGENDREKKYNSISHIFRGKKGRRTRAENIDMFRDIARKARAATGTLRTDIDPAIVSAKKEEVRRAHRLRDDEEAARRGAEAIRWLADSGIETRRRSDGYPIWPDQGGS